MSYVNVGAYINGKRPSSKTALRTAVKNAPETVSFDSTALMGEQFDGSAVDLEEGTKLSVTGPDPYTSRKWYATVERTAKGLKVS